MLELYLGSVVLTSTFVSTVCVVAPKQGSVLSQTDYILDVSAERSTLKMEMELLVYFR